MNESVGDGWNMYVFLLTAEKARALSRRRAKTGSPAKTYANIGGAWRRANRTFSSFLSKICSSRCNLEQNLCSRTDLLLWSFFLCSNRTLEGLPIVLVSFKVTCFFTMASVMIEDPNEKKNKPSSESLVRPSIWLFCFEPDLNCCTLDLLSLTHSFFFIAVCLFS